MGEIGFAGRSAHSASIGLCSSGFSEPPRASAIDRQRATSPSVWSQGS